MRFCSAASSGIRLFVHRAWGVADVAPRSGLRDEGGGAGAGFGSDSIGVEAWPLEATGSASSGSWRVQLRKVFGWGLPSSKQMALRYSPHEMRSQFSREISRFRAAVRLCGMWLEGAVDDVDCVFIVGSRSGSICDWQEQNEGSQEGKCSREVR
jgi:hypothetical protein